MISVPTRFLGRARTQIPIPVRLKQMRAERVAEEVEAFLSSILQRGLGLIEGQPEFHHHHLCPRHSLCRTTAAENDEVISIRDDMRPERITTFGQPPVFQEPVHVDVGKHRACNPALRRAARVAPAATHAPGPIPSPFLDRRLQPQLDQPQHGTIRDAASHRLEEVAVRNRIEGSGHRLPITVIFQIR